MKILGIILGILAMIGMMIAFIPLLGWLNWFNIPFAVVGLIISVIAKSKEGTILCVLAVIFGILRLFLGGGIL
ncbi:MAG: hypothetical protein IPM38_19490 [Ignavibacteria bacterium]|nr:hypothetical protein [Ignavibacteria bacterium]